MSNKSAGHPIAVVAARTGLSRDVIRMWERRYGAVEPDRTPGGQRLYTDEQLNRFRLLAAATASGRSIRTVASLPTPELERLVADDAAHHHPAALPEGGSTHAERADAAFALTMALDGAGLDRELRRTVATLGTPVFLEDVVPALMRRIGDEWQAGRLAIAHEHLASAAVLAIILETLRAVSDAPGAPRLLVTTPAGERHAVGAALAAAAAALDGWAITYLGVDVPAEDVVSAAVAVDADAVALSIVHTENPAAVVRDLHAIRASLPERVTLIAGGAAASRMADNLAQPGLIVCQNLPDLRRVLASEMRARSAARV